MSLPISWYVVSSIPSKTFDNVGIKDLEATLWLEQHLIDQTRTLVLTSHDQVFLISVVEETIILRDRTLRYFEGTPRAFEVDERKRRKALLKQQSAMDKKKEHVSLELLVPAREFATQKLIIG